MKIKNLNGSRPWFGSYWIVGCSAEIWISRHFSCHGSCLGVRTQNEEEKLGVIDVVVVKISLMQSACCINTSYHLQQQEGSDNTHWVLPCGPATTRVPFSARWGVTPHISWYKIDRGFTSMFCWIIILIFFCSSVDNLIGQWFLSLYIGECLTNPLITLTI